MQIDPKWNERTGAAMHGYDMNDSFGTYATVFETETYAILACANKTTDLSPS